jgi:hypothetical protein
MDQIKPNTTGLQSEPEFDEAYPVKSTVYHVFSMMYGRRGPEVDTLLSYTWPETSELGDHLLNMAVLAGASEKEARDQLFGRRLEQFDILTLRLRFQGTPMPLCLVKFPNFISRKTIEALVRVHDESGTLTQFIKEARI